MKTKRSAQKVEYKNHQVIHLNKDSYFFEVNTIDKEHLDPTQKENLFYNLANSLTRLKDGEDFYKVYHIGNKIVLQTENPDPIIEGWEILPTEDYFFDIFGSDNFYSEPFFGPDFINFNGEYQRFISFYDFPHIIDSEIIATFGNLFINFKKVPTEISKIKAKRSAEMHKANIEGRKSNQIESNRAYQDLNEIIEKLVDGTTSLFKFQCWVVITSTDLDELHKKTSDTLSAMKRCDIIPHIESIALKDIFRSYVPSNYIEFSTRSHETPSEYLSAFIPFNGDYLHSLNTKGIDLNDPTIPKAIEFRSLTGGRIYFNLFNEDLSNSNLLIVGKTGYGKSMIANEIIFSEIIDRGRSAVIIDKGYSYRKLAKYLKANEFSEKLNPMQFAEPNFLHYFIMSTIGEGEINKKIGGMIFTHICEFLQTSPSGTFQDLIDYLESHIKDIKYYFAELLPFITNEKIIINRLTYLDYTKWPLQILPPLLVYMYEYFKRIPDYKIFQIDEAWLALENLPNFVSELFRTISKHKGSAIAITQTFTELVEGDNKIGRVVLNSCDHKMSFNQTYIPKGIMDEYSEERIKNLVSIPGNFSQVLYFSESSNKIIEYKAEPLKYCLFISRGSDNDSLNEYLKDCEHIIGFKNAIHNYSNYRFGTGFNVNFHVSQSNESHQKGYLQ